MFSTHLLPLARGILSTLYVWLDERHEAAEVEALYRQFYAERPMVRLWPAGSVAGAAACGAHEFLRYRVCAGSQRGKRLVVVSCLDNLGKGAAGQAVQNMNGMMGFQEAVGLQ